MKIVIGGIMMLLGAIALVVGHFVTQGGITAVKTALREFSEMNSEADFEENFAGGNATQTATLYSVTNALAVQEDGATPIFETKKVTFDLEEVNYHPLVSDDGESYTFKKWLTYHVTKDSEAVLDEEITTVNPVYLAALRTAAGDESTLMLGSANAVVGQMAGVFLEYVPQFMQLSSITGYLGGLSAALQANGMTAEQVIEQWHSGFGAPLAVALGNAAFTGFEVQDDPVGVDAAGAAYLWDPSSTYSFMSPEGMAAWTEAAQCTMAAGDDYASICVVEGLAAFDIAEDVGLMNFFGAMAWIQSLTTTNDAYYFGVIKAGLVGAGLAGVADADNWSDLGALQFGTGQIVYGMTGGAATSLVALGIEALPFTSSPEITCYAEEYNTAVGGLAEYGADATLAPFPAGAGLSIDQVKAFFTVFSQQDKTIGFLQAAGAAAAGDTSLITAVLSDATYAATGLSPTNWMIYANYLSVRLPKDILIGDAIVGFPLNEYGVGSVNSGLFMRRTVREILFGWADPIFTVMGSDAEWNGILGKLYDSPEEQDAMVLDASRTYSRKTGVGSLNAADSQEEIMWHGVSEFTSRDDLPGGTCEDVYTLMILQDPETCAVWTETETITGLSSKGQVALTSEDWTWDNYMDVGAEVDEYNVWDEMLMRGVPMINVGEADVGDGIRTHEFTVAAHPAFLGDCSDGAKPCNEANAKYRMNMGDGVMPMEYAYGGVPMVASVPYFLNADGTKNEGVLECLDTSALPQEYDHATMGTWLKVEPLSGKTLDGAFRMQLNFDVNSQLLNGGVYSNLFAEGCEDMIWPFFILEVTGQMTDSQAKDFKTLVYGSIDFLKLIWFVMGIAGALMAICGITLVTVGVTQKNEKSVGSTTGGV